MRAAGAGRAARVRIRMRLRALLRPGREAGGRSPNRAGRRCGCCSPFRRCCAWCAPPGFAVSPPPVDVFSFERYRDGAAAESLSRGCGGRAAEGPAQLGASSGRFAPEPDARFRRKRVSRRPARPPGRNRSPGRVRASCEPILKNAISVRDAGRYYFDVVRDKSLIV